MSAVCPVCGAPIDLVPGSTPGASVAHPPAQVGANPGTSPEVAHKVLDLELDPSPNGTRAYNQGYPAVFEVWWKVYPLHLGKRKALKAWRNAVRRIGTTSGASQDEAQAQLLAGAIRYRDDPNRIDEYTKYAEGWLNADRWEDDPLPFRLKPQDPEAEERERRRQQKHEAARRFVEEERRVRRQEPS